MSNSVIKVESISKYFRLGIKSEKSDTLMGRILQAIQYPWKNLKNLRELNHFQKEDDSFFWALKDLSFEVKEGEVLGIIGKNGAGKSTLLKILSQITEPTFGHVEIFGRVSSLLEVGTGFHPELSGRDNIYMNGTILGMTKREIDIKIDEIIDFSGVEKFIDTPVKFYSSGMKVRLGFSVAAHLEPEILIVDEVLSVGDYDFQAKCLGKINSVSKQGRTVLFVSHNLEAVKALCSRVLVLKNGELKFDGDVKSGIKCYLGSQEINDDFNINLTRHDDKIDPKLGLISAKIFIDRVLGNEIYAGQELKVLLEYKVEESHLNIPMEVGFGLFDQEGKGLLAFNNSNFKQKVELDRTSGGVEICIPQFPFYRSDKLSFSFYFGYMGDYYEVLNRAASLNCLQNDYLGTGRSFDDKLNTVYVPEIYFKVN